VARLAIVVYSCRGGYSRQQCHGKFRAGARYCGDTVPDRRRFRSAISSAKRRSSFALTGASGPPSPWTCFRQTGASVLGMTTSGLCSTPRVSTDGQI
jgi:hypothetical protein